MPDFPIGIADAVGGVIDGKILVCGGKIPTDSGPYSYHEHCYTFNENQWIRSTKLKTQGIFQAGVVLNNNHLWLTGGTVGKFDVKDETEYIFSNGTTIMGPKLPTGMNGHCVVLLKNGNVMFMRKFEVWQYNILTEDFTQMTQMPESHPMLHSGCTAFKSAKHNNREVVFIGGGNQGNKALILDYTMTENWEESRFFKF